MTRKKKSLDELVQSLAFHNHKIRESHPEAYERNHFNLMSIGYSDEGPNSLSIASCMILFNYFKNWVYEDSRKNYAALISEERGRAVVDHVHYEPELKILHNLNKRLSYSNLFACHLGVIAEEAIDQLSQKHDLPAMAALLPYASAEKKLFFASEYAEIFTNLVTKNLRIEVKNPYFSYTNETTDSLAFYTTVEHETEGEIPLICFTARGMKLEMPNFLGIVQHELTHHVVSSFGKAETEWEIDIYHPYHDYSDDIILTYAKGKNGDVSSGFYPSLYDEDKEEDLCNIVGYMAGAYIARFSPDRQIAHYPVLKI